MPETRRETETTEKDPDGTERVRDAREADVGLDSRETEDQSEGVGYADERSSPDTEHKTGRTDSGTAM